MDDTEKAGGLKYLKNSCKEDGAKSPSAVPGHISRGNAHRLLHGCSAGT